ncbi:MAG: hypothetical protein ACU0BP_14250 [Sulfitobacter sp.]
MKHLLMTTALAAAFATPVWANDSEIEQIGADNSAEVTQNAGAGGTSDILQTGDGDAATVMQSDTLSGGTDTNRANIRQLGGSGVQTAAVTQDHDGTGSANIANVLQDSIEGGNTIEVDQNGAANLAEAQQGPGEAENCTLVFGCSSVTPLGITNSSSDIFQSGSANTAITKQIVGSNGGDNNHASITQDGSDNQGTVAQGTGILNAVGFVSPSISNPASNDNDNSAWIDQSGLANIANIGQGGELGSASSTQSGEDNKSTITQSGGSVLLSVGNSANVTQSGERNTSVVEQTSADGDLPETPAGTTANVSQTGSDNGSTVRQLPLGGHFASVTQNGELLSSLVEQDGLLNSATVTQELNNQTSEVLQLGTSGTAAILNTANVSQTHTANNLSQVTQAGTGNSTTVMQ